jgi:hypothetical protein
MASSKSLGRIGRVVPKQFQQANSRLRPASVRISFALVSLYFSKGTAGLIVPFSRATFSSTG